MYTQYRITIHVTSYIACPYWPELDEIINIQKPISRLKNEGRRQAALKVELDHRGMTHEDYKALLAKAQRKWYTDDSGKIIIPRHHVAGCLVQTVRTAPAAIRGKFDGDSFRHYVRLSDFTTPKTEKDSFFDRYVKNDNTNQRRRTVDEVVENFEAEGVIELHEDFKIQDLEKLFKYALANTGLGSCRKMGYGRATLSKVEAL